ncbi:MAG: hypothetical protein EPN85_07590 [Bacteroidetes bacterium]|nr:MAG: hypothetical protein EPN85_07590 [Bacteroidota bacterium]
MLLKKSLLLIFIFFSFCRGWTQDSLGAPKKYRQTIEFNGLGYLNSTTIQNDFVRTFYYGKFIDENLKFTATRKMEESNLLGGMTRAGFSYTCQSLEGNNAPIFTFSFLDRTHIDIKFSDDLFNIIFYGNKKFAGQTAKMGDFSLDLLRYQQFRFGWSRKGDASHGAYGFAFSLLSGEQNTSVKMPVADLFTADDGTFLDFDVTMDVHQTDTAHKGYFAQNGMGISTDFFYEMPYICWGKPGKIRFDIKDLGFIRWNSASMHYSADSAYHYEGVEVSDLFNMDSAVSPLNIDKVIDKNTSFRREKYTPCIPGALDIHTKSFYGKQFAFEKGFTWRFNTNAKMYYYAKLHFLPGRSKSVDIAYVLGYGGYGRFNSGLDLTADIGKYYSFQFMNYYLFSDVTAQSTTGMGAFVKLLRKF